MRKPNWSRVGLVLLMMMLLLIPIACSSFRHLWHGADDYCLDNAQVCENPSMMALGRDLDHLERHLERFGSAVAKHPDIWGEARLTMYREQFEKEMRKDLENFQVRLQANLSRSDQAYLASATSLGFAVRSRSGGDGASAASSSSAVQVTDPNSLVSSTDAVINRNPASVERIGFGDLKTSGISLEPTVVLAQKKRYLDFLNQLRRENEGDDTADAPGYSLNLVRIPVSIHPGKFTDRGHGAEVTMSLHPILSPDLLPTTFRNLVSNDLVTHLGYPLSIFLNQDDMVALLTEENRKKLQGEEVVRQLKMAAQSGNPIAVHTFLKSLSAQDAERLEATLTDLHKPSGDALKSLRTGRNPGIGALLQTLPNLQERTRRWTQEKLEDSFSIPGISFSNGVRDNEPFPHTHIINVYGVENSFEIAYQVRKALTHSIEQNGYVHLPDIQNYLRSEIEAAHRLLQQADAQQLWTQFCTPELVNAVRTRKNGRLEEMGDQFRQAMAKITQSEIDRQRKPHLQLMHFSVTSALAWCIIVDSALLTDRLLQDMRHIAAEKKCPLLCDRWLPFYLPNPPPDVRAIFNQYVHCRWPLIVFALDPVDQQQNVADTLSTRRETQLALSMAFVSGRMNARQMFRYTRRLEAEYETIALNSTHSGFSHGNNVFGWRFRPRFQTPDTESNLTVLTRDLLIGGPSKNRLLRQRRLEAGQRECVAIVLMPSFVPHVRLEVVSNWFALTNPKRKLGDHTQALRLSKRVQTLRNCAPQISDAECYRPGELDRMLNRIEQLESRLPTQTEIVQVPIINSIGGFELFNNGTTDLAPELYGWYGAPGVQGNKDTSLFLVGDHFSVHQTRVIVGNTRIDIDLKKNNQEMLSRQVIRVTIPANTTIPVKSGADGKTYVQVHIATPYGVTRELMVPYFPKLPESKPVETAPGFKLSKTTIKAQYQLIPLQGVDRFAARFIPGSTAVKGSEIQIDWTHPVPSPISPVTAVFTFSHEGHDFAVKLENLVTTTRSFKLSPDQLEYFANFVITKLGHTLLHSPEKPLPKSISSTSITITPTNAGKPINNIAAENQLKLDLTLIPTS